MFLNQRLPAWLSEVRKGIRAFSVINSDLDALVQAWENYLAEARTRVRAIHIEGDGETVYLGGLSPGCRACKLGRWDCLFVTSRCNASCRFCCSPSGATDDQCGSALARRFEDIADAYARAGVNGIAFTGGEPLVEKERLFDWASHFRHLFPDAYLWVYTNGLLADEAVLRRLAEIGLDEIRFDMAATGYDHPLVTRNLRDAARWIPNLTVEIPSIPDDVDRLLAQLTEWSGIGVEYLNLHELLYEPGSNSWSLPGPRQSIALPDGHHFAIHPASRRVVLEVMTAVEERGLRISVNDCSLQSKLLQIRGRRRNAAALASAPHEKLTGEMLQSVAGYRDETDFFVCHPDEYPEMRRQRPDYRFVRLTRLAPLSVTQPPQWVRFEPLA